MDLENSDAKKGKQIKESTEDTYTYSRRVRRRIPGGLFHSYAGDKVNASNGAMKMERRRSRVHRQYFSREFREEEKKTFGGFRVDGESEKKRRESVEEREKKKLTEIEGKLLCPLVVEEKTI